MKSLFSPNAHPARLVFASMMVAQVALLLLRLFYPLRLFPSLGEVVRSPGDLAGTLRLRRR